MHTTTISSPTTTSVRARRHSLALTRWLDLLHPHFEVITTVATSLGVAGNPTIIGPVLLNADGRPARIRRGMTWPVNGLRAGFLVDFCPRSITVQAWSPHSRVTITNLRHLTSTGLGRDLRTALTRAGLYRTPRTL